MFLCYILAFLRSKSWLRKLVGQRAESNIPSLRGIHLNFYLCLVGYLCLLVAIASVCFLSPLSYDYSRPRSRLNRYWFKATRAFSPPTHPAAARTSLFVPRGSWSRGGKTIAQDHHFSEQTWLPLLEDAMQSTVSHKY